MKKIILLSSSILLLPTVSFAKMQAPVKVKIDPAVKSCQKAKKPIPCLTPLAENNNIQAQTILGLIYETGKNVKKDYTKAIYWYTKSAKQGNIIAENQLGSLYYGGKGTKQDYKKAMYWYKQSATQNSIPAQYNLGIMYASGNGFPKDNIKAYAWLSIAFKNGGSNELLKIIKKELSSKQLAQGKALAQTIDKTIKQPN